MNQPEVSLPAAETDDAHFLPDDYESDHLARGGNAKPTKEHDALSSNTQALLEKLNGVKGVANEIQASKETKIIFCSRTHSQLTQFVKELRRVKPPPSIISLNEKDIDKSPSPLDEEIVKHLCLGSRKNLCINPKVSRLGLTAAINERCLDLQKPGVPDVQKCGFLPKKDNEDLVATFRDHALAEIHDIEDLGNLGRNIGVCPYYASRAVIESTEILTLPYPLLLQKSAREALGVSVKDHIVIIDEAHNLMDAISDTYSCSISLSQIETATSQVMAYIQKFKNRLKGKNRMYVTQIIRLLNSISDCLRSVAISTRGSEAIIRPAQLLAGKGVDQIQPHKLINYLQESKLAYKVEDYAQSIDQTAKAGTNNSDGRGALQAFQSFLAVLMNPSAEGRFFFARDEHNPIQIRYTLIDPREHFRDIVEEARAVILAGGTMSPMSDYKDYLFSYLPPDRLKTFSFGHVVPPENIFAQSLSSGPSGVEFDFTFEKRKSETMLIELGMLFIRACTAIPDGVVAFFPSYDFLSHIVSVWKKTPLPGNKLNQNNTSIKPPTSIFSALNAIKPIFHETKSTPTPRQPFTQQHHNTNPNFSPPQHPSQTPLSQETLLQSYSRTIDQDSITRTHKGALLLSITSGSLSEGINFSDSLARAVFAIGLPYPNPHSAVWKAKLQHVEDVYLEKIHTSAASSTTSDHASASASASAIASSAAKAASREYYENATLRAINQSIGRAIRHRADYAAILLVDRRWEGGGGGGGAGVSRKLPGWIVGSMGDGREGGVRRRRMEWGQVESDLKKFFERKS